jgi:hypothetical protein
MTEDEEFTKANLEGIRVSRISNLLKEQNEQKEQLEISLKDDNIQNNENAEKLVNDDKYKNQKNIGDSYIFVFVDFLCQSLISLGFYYLSYFLKFDFDDIILKLSLAIIFIIFSFFIVYSGRVRFNRKHWKLSNYILFLLINLLKIDFDIFLYLMIISDKEDDGIDFSHFEARAYWKISISLFYLFLIYYYYFKKESNSFNIYIYLIDSFACVVICSLLIVFTKTKNDNMFRIINYIGYLGLELFFVIYSIYFEFKHKKIYEYLQIKIDWRVNRIDFLRFGIPIFAVLGNLLKYFTKKCRC